MKLRCDLCVTYIIYHILKLKNLKLEQIKDILILSVIKALASESDQVSWLPAFGRAHASIGATFWALNWVCCLKLISEVFCLKQTDQVFCSKQTDQVFCLKQTNHCYEWGVLFKTNEVENLRQESEANFGMSFRASPSYWQGPRLHWGDNLAPN